MRVCPCGFDPPGVAMFSHAWHVGHELAHVAAFPEVDERTREILRDSCLQSVDSADKV